VTFWALGEIVKSHAGILESDSPEEVAKKLAAAVADVVDDGDDRSWFVARLGVLVGAEGAQAADREESFTAWRRFLEAIAARTPFVLVVEDVHWADAALLAFLDHLVEWGSGVPLLVVCTARPELYERDLDWGSGKRNASMLTLSPLTEAETAELVDTLSSQAALPADTRAVLLERAGGNPLYAEEFVRMLLDRGFLGRREPVAAVALGAEIPVPETVQGLIAARLQCTYMFPPLALGGCRLVRGLIQASATCDEFRRRPRS
jgi:predicted ATPase